MASQNCIAQLVSNLYECEGHRGTHSHVLDSSKEDSQINSERCLHVEIVREPVQQSVSTELEQPGTNYSRVLASRVQYFLPERGDRFETANMIGEHRSTVQKHHLRLNMKTYSKLHNNKTVSSRQDSDECGMQGKRRKVRTSSLDLNNSDTEQKQVPQPVSESFIGNSRCPSIAQSSNYNRGKLSKCETILAAGKDDSYVENIKSTKGKEYRGPRKCEFCEKIMPNKATYGRHRLIHTGEKPWVCQICSKSFNAKMNLMSHEKTHIKRERDFECSTCNKKFYTLHTLQHHVRQVHEAAYVTCELCGCQLKSKSGLKLHMESTHSDEIYSCVKCNQEFKTATYLERHMVMVHTKEKRFTCAYCDERFRCQRARETHVNTQHTKRSFICEVCGNVYATKPVLDKHAIKVHGNEKPKECNLCNKKVSNYYNHMKMHRSYEQGELHHCALCSKSFPLKMYLHQHMRVHNDYKYECDKCSKTFNFKSGLKVHEVRGGCGQQEMAMRQFSKRCVKQLLKRQTNNRTTCKSKLKDTIIDTPVIQPVEPVKTEPVQIVVNTERPLPTPSNPTPPLFIIGQLSSLLNAGSSAGWVIGSCSTINLAATTRHKMLVAEGIISNQNIDNHQQIMIQDGQISNQNIDNHQQIIIQDGRISNQKQVMIRGRPISNQNVDSQQIIIQDGKIQISNTNTVMNCESNSLLKANDNHSHTRANKLLVPSDTVFSTSHFDPHDESDKVSVDMTVELQPQLEEKNMDQSEHAIYVAPTSTITTHNHSELITGHSLDEINEYVNAQQVLGHAQSQHIGNQTNEILVEADAVDNKLDMFTGVDTSEMDGVDSVQDIERSTVVMDSDKHESNSLSYMHAFAWQL